MEEIVKKKPGRPRIHPVGSRAEIVRSTARKYYEEHREEICQKSHEKYIKKSQTRSYKNRSKYSPNPISNDDFVYAH